MLLLQLVLFLVGFLQGFLLTTLPKTAYAIRRFLGRPQTNRASASEMTLAILLSLIPGLLWLLAVNLGGVSPPVGRIFVLGIFPGLFVGIWSRGRELERRGDPIESMLAVTKDPPVAIFGKFANEDREMEDFMKALGDRSTRKLWRKFQSIPVDLDEDGEVLAKYAVDPLRGLQAMFFRKDGTRIEFDGNDRIFAEDMLDPRRFETRLQSALSLWSLS